MLYSLKMRSEMFTYLRIFIHLLISEIFDKKVRKKVYDKYCLIYAKFSFNFIYIFIIILFILVNFMQFISIESRN